jgi:alditol oxidase
LAQNWAGNISYQTEILRPQTKAELAELVAGATSLRVVGSGHSFNRLPDSADTLVSIAGLPEVFEIDPVARQVRISAGYRYGDVARRLHEQGWALHNLASLGHISVAGAVATATHGSGSGNQNLASQVVGLRVMAADGSESWVRQDDPDFAGYVVGLGALGVVTELELSIQPSFEVTQTIYVGAQWSAVLPALDAVMGHYSVSLFTSWQPEGPDQIWVKRRTDVTASGEFGFGEPAGAKLHPLPGIDPVHCTEQLGVSGPWHERLPHFKLEFTPSNGEEVQSEWLIDRRFAGEAIAALIELAPKFRHLLQISEIRAIRADDFWLSSAYGRDTIGLHFTWHKTDEIYQVLPEIEEALAGFGLRPHWGKVFAENWPAVRREYPRFGDWVALCNRVDPSGKFRNEFVSSLIG